VVVSQFESGGAFANVCNPAALCRRLRNGLDFSGKKCDPGLDGLPLCPYIIPRHETRGTSQGTKLDRVRGVQLNGEAKELYELILYTANKFLVAARKFEVHILRDFQPSFGELAEICQDIGGLVYDLVFEDDPHLASQCEEYVALMKHLATAIRNGDEDEKLKAVAILEKKPFVMPH
jgi:hypothetical protein